jgi:hypothetical protein
MAANAVGGYRHIGLTNSNDLRMVERRFQEHFIERTASQPCIPEGRMP